MSAQGSSGVAGAGLARFLPADATREQVRQHGVVVGMCLAVLLLLVGLFYVWTRMQQVQIGYEISRLEAMNKELKNRKRELHLELSSLQSPRELEAKAKKLGLVRPSMDRVVHVP